MHNKKEPCYILGFSAYYHDSAAALIKDGEIVAAAEEERFTRKKHEGGFPIFSIKYCLKEARISLQEVDYVIFHEKPFLRFERILETFTSYAPRGGSLFLKAMPLWLKDKIHMKTTIYNELKNIDKISKDKLPKILFSEHHLSHAASAFYPSPFKRAGILCIDGVGEWATTSAWNGNGSAIEPLWEIRFPHSLGLLYSSFTYYTGFKVNSGEYKLMGLAPYGTPKYTQKIFDNLIDLKNDGTFRLNMEYFSYPTSYTMINKKFCNLFGMPARQPEEKITQFYMDIAKSIQKVTEEVVLRLAKTMYNEVNKDYLCLAGGVALNCVANGKILQELNFKKIWIQPAASDAGSALGASLAAWHIYLKNPKKNIIDKMQGSYLGPHFNSNQIEDSLKKYNHNYNVYKEKELISLTANYLKQGKVIGWFQGRMEFGPRALGNRSILGDPRKPYMQKVMNLKIKFRESFRPFAPIVKEEKASEFFEINSKSPYMLIVAPLQEKYLLKPVQDKKEVQGLDKLNVLQSKLPAITHVDLSARIQTVSKISNRRLYNLLEEFEKLSGYPILINTSFNVRGEPIVCTPEEAYLCFMRTEMDILVIENMVFIKENQGKLDDKFNINKNLELD